MKEKVIKFIDIYIIGAFIKIFTLFGKHKIYKIYDIEKYKNFLLIRPGGIGDAVLLTPLIKYLHSNGKQVDIFCMHRNKGFFDILKKEGYINNIFLLDSVKNIVSIMGSKFDVIFDTEQFFYSGTFIAKFFIKKELFVGFDTNSRRYLYNFFIKYRQEEYEAQSFLNLLSVFGLQEKAIFQKNILKKTKYLSVFNGGSNEVRKIDLDNLIGFLRKIGKNYDKVFIIGGKGERNDAEVIIKKSQLGNIENKAGKLNLQGTLDILKQTSTLISTDSGPLHLGVYAGVEKIYGIFGPGIVEKWGGGDIQVIRQEKLACIGCNYGRYSQTPKCPYNYKCLKELDILNYDIT